MKNIEMKSDGNVLTIQVDVIEVFGLYSSGTSSIIASTEWNRLVDLMRIDTDG